MDQKEQIQAFADDVQALVGRYANEFELSSAAAVGVLMQQIRNIQDDVMQRHDDGET